MMNVWSIQRFRILVLIVAIAGLTQGLLIPLLTTLLEEQGYSSSQNGMSAAALYVGILVMSPFGARIVKRFGYKQAILIGLMITALSVILFPFFTGIWIWSLLRFLVGAGDSLLHYATQLWITTTAPAHERGKRISQYGFSYGLGFGIGPLGMNLLPFGAFAPFLVTLAIILISFYFVAKLDSGKDMAVKNEERQEEVKVSHIYKYAIVALCPSMLYGFLETAMAGNFPVVGLREGISTAWISILISAFVWGSLAFQVPLGIIGDKIGRRNLLIMVCFLGAIGMVLVPFLIPHVYLLFITFSLIGGLVGSIFSLGMAYLTDLLPPRYLAKSNAIASMHFSLGSILGPYFGGIFIQYMGSGFLFYFIAFTLFAFVILAITYPVMRESDPIPTRQKIAS